MKTELIRIGLELLLAILIAVALPYLRKIARVMSLFKDYPPHRHTNGQVVYPPDFGPGQVQNLQQQR